MARRSALAQVRLAAWCVLACACHPPDANLGGEWSCPSDKQAQCFFFDSGLDPSDAGSTAPIDAGLALQADHDAVRALFDAPQNPDSTKAPIIAYPLDQTTEPSNIYDLDIQWHRLDSSQKIFRIRVESPSLPYGRYDLYTQCFPKNDGCHYSVPDAEGTDPGDMLWQTNVLVPLKGQDAVLTVAGSDGAGGMISVSPPIHFRASYSTIIAGLYYWSAHKPGAAPDAPDQGTTYRLAVGARTAAPFIQPQKENPDTCEGCHAVSRDGSTIAFTATSVPLAGAGAGVFFAASTTTPSQPLVPPASMPDSALIALSHDGKLAVIGRNNELWLRNTVEGSEQQISQDHFIDETGAQVSAYFPDFSTNDDRLAVTLSGHADSPWAVSTGSIATLDFDHVNTFSQAKVLVPMTDQDFNFYPSWSPDGNWIVFASAPRGEDPSRCMPPTTPCPNISYDQTKARLRVAHFPDGRVYELTRATQGVGVTSTWPKFSPLNDNNEMFITFNSMMPYGIEVPTGAPAQLWLSVLNFDNLPDDPSSAPVWLPFQSFGQKNHLAYWTDTVPCRTDVSENQGCGPDETCVMLVPHTPGFCNPNTVVK